MKIVEKQILSFEEKEILRETWNVEYPVKLRYKTAEDFDIYLNGLLNIKHYLLSDDENKINGWVYTFLREEETWFGLILNHNFQGKGNGTILLNEIKSKNNSLNGWVSDGEKDVKQNGSFYKSPMQFYLKNGFIFVKQVKIFGEVLNYYQFILS